MNIEKTHIKALLSNPQARKWILNWLEDERLVSDNPDNLSASAFGDLHDAVLEAFGNEKIPAVERYWEKTDDGDCPIEILVYQERTAKLTQGQGPPSSSAFQSQLALEPEPPSPAA